MAIRVLICDQQAFVRSGLRAMLAPEIDIEVVGETARWQELDSIACMKRPDIVMLGISAEPNLLVAVTSLCAESRRYRVIIAIHGLIEDDMIIRMLLAGAKGVIGPEGHGSAIPEGIRSVAGGGAVITPMVARRLLDRLSMLPPYYLEKPRSFDELSRREVEILRILASGHSNTEIAHMLNISDATVRSHVSHLLSKLNLRNRVEAVIFAHRHGLTAELAGVPAVAADRAPGGEW
jgi:DNA-binding NarL/FixJ family response regulator